MALDTYDGLQEEIASWAWRTGDTEFEARVPTFISLVEVVLNHGAEGIDPLRVRDMEASATVTLTDGMGDLPADYLQYREVYANTSPKRLLSAVDPNWGDENYPNTDADCASFFSIRGGEIITFPKSSSNLTLHYYQKIPALSDSNTSNWLLEKAPTVYLYGALLQAAPFMMDDARMGTWGQMFASALGGLRNSDVMSKYARASARVRGPTP